MNPTNHELATALKEMSERAGIALGDALVLRLAAEQLREDLADSDYLPPVPQFVGALTDDDGWIEWDGLAYESVPNFSPVSKGKIIDVRFRDGMVLNRVPAGEHAPGSHRQAKGAFWRKDNADDDIVAYRLSCK